MNDITPADIVVEVEAEAKANVASMPDYMTDPNAVLMDSKASWRYEKSPDYSKTRNFYASTKRTNHPIGSLPFLVENLVKNWEIEASFKPNLSDWRTVNHSKYSFSMNGGTPQPAEHMLKVGTYNAIISPNEYYSPESSDFASSHKTFKRMMPTFAWEVLEVYSGPPVVALRWRHWGEMKNDYVGFNDKGEKVTAKAHGGSIDIQGITIATLDDDMKLTHLDTFQDPMDMFRQIAPQGIVNKQPMNGSNPEGILDAPDNPTSSRPISSSSLSLGRGAKGALGKTYSGQGGYIGNLVLSALSVVRSKGKSSKSGADPRSPIHESGKQECHCGTMLGGSSSNASQEGTGKSHASTAVACRHEDNHASDFLKTDCNTPNVRGDVKPAAEQAIVSAPPSRETQFIHEEITSAFQVGCPFLMNRE